MRIAFAGFRHGHIFGVYEKARDRDDLEIVAACEDDEATRAKLAAEGTVELTHAGYAEMLAEVPCEIVAVGDYYRRRGEIIIAALEAGRHVISDKPICTSRAELARIEVLVGETGLRVGCQLGLRYDAKFRTMRRLIAEGAIGEVHTVCFSGQHPLLYGSRPKWYFEPGLQGGTINDIAVHGLDLVGWLTGRVIVEVVTARAWNARLGAKPFFQDGAQMMLRMDNDGGVIGDVSYLAPDGCGYVLPQYWRVTCHGDSGVVETSIAGSDVLLARSADKAMQAVPPDAVGPGGPLDSLLNEIAGNDGEVSPSTAEVLAASRVTLTAQEAADKDLHNVLV